MNSITVTDTGPKTYRFTVEDYHRMAEANVFGEDARVELIDGEIYDMSPINSPHADCVDRLNEWFILHFHKQAIVRAQNPVTLNEHSEPEPDLALAVRKPNGYRSAHPKPEEILLVIEVADSSLEKDRNVKLPGYARAGIPEAWLVVLGEKIVEVHTQPSAEGYDNIRIFREGKRIDSPQVKGLAVDEVFGRIK
ncbi:MAG: Uma2 family endonuclease [Phaeodactylibacter sp.]|nr:Uma2 family endonuclease [Phaeodactylibacter sp.]